MALTGNRLKTLAESMFTVVQGRSTKDELVMICEQPRCGDQSGNRSLNLKTGKTNCWRCNVGGDFVRWLRSLGYEPDLSNAELYQERTLDTVDSDLKELGKQNRRIVASINNIELPPGFIKLEDAPDSGYARLIERMAIRKNLDLQAFIEMGAGFTRESARWEPFCIFPVFEWGRIVYYQGRTYNDPKPDPETGKKPSTKQFPTKEEVKLGSRYWVYNIDKLRSHGKIGIVVESMFNVKSLERELGTDDIVPIGVFKHKISAEQQAKILTAKGLKEICLMFDPDAISASWESCSKLANIVKVTVAPPLPAGTDPNDDPKAALDTFERRTPFNVRTELDNLVADL